MEPVTRPVSRAHGLVVLILALAIVVSLTSATRKGDGATLAAGDQSSFTVGSADDDDVTATDATGDVAGGTASAGDGATTGISGGTRSGGQARPGGSTAAVPDKLPPVKVAWLATDDAGVSAISGSANPGEGAEGARQNREFQALFDWANKHGGVAGRRIDARGFTLTVNDILSEERLAQICVQVTEDYGAEYVIDTVAMRYLSSQSCFAQHKTVLVTVASSASERDMRSLVPYVATTWPTIDRQFQALVPQLSAAGYFQGGTVGVFLDDRPSVVQAYEQVLLPALRQAKAEPAAVARASQNDTAQQANAVLQFRSRGVNRVIFVGNTIHYLGFSNTADSQGYYPRYAFPDYGDGAGAYARFGSASQMKDALAVSACEYFTVCIADAATRSGNDVTTPLDPKTLSAGMRRCLDVLTEARKVNYYDPQGSGQSGGVPYVCDHFFLWLEAARATGPSVLPGSWGQGLRALGRGYLSGFIHGTDFSDGRQSGASQFATGIYDAYCICYVRRSPWAG